MIIMKQDDDQNNWRTPRPTAALVLENRAQEWPAAGLAVVFSAWLAKWTSILVDPSLFAAKKDRQT